MVAQVIFVHPNYLPGPQVPGLPPFVADFLLDTVRAATLYVSQAPPALLNLCDISEEWLCTGLHGDVFCCLIELHS